MYTKLYATKFRVCPIIGTTEIHGSIIDVGVLIIDVRHHVRFEILWRF